MKQLLLLILLLSCTITFAQKRQQSIGFVENKGQIVDQNGKPNQAVKYLLNTKGLNVQLKKNGFSYDVYETKKHAIVPSVEGAAKTVTPFSAKDTLPDYTLEYMYHRIDIDFLNSSTQVKLVSNGTSTDFDNYYNIPNKPDGILGVHKYQEITYKNIYPNIDVIFTIPKDSLKPVEYNFIVHPKGKISDIQMKFSGAQTKLVNNKIQMQVRFGTMEESLPMSWIADGKSKKEITIGYSKIKNNVYGFTGFQNFPNKTLVIDPVPTRLWGTYYGGEGSEFASSITTNRNNDVFIAGTTLSSTNIATSGTYSPNLTGKVNLFFAKLDSNGNRIWGTYFRTNNGWGITHPVIATDNNNNLFFASSEYNSTNVATPGAFQTVKNDYDDIILAKLNESGIREWATYYGGDSVEMAYSICTDNFNNVYIAGETYSSDIMASSGAHQTTNSNNKNTDGFIAKFSATGNRIWGTYYGGVGFDSFYYISISDDGFLYATGNQGSSTNIATPGAYQEIYKGANYYGTSFNANVGGMIVKFTLDGQRVWGTYICDDGYIYRAKLQGDNLYLSGNTRNKTTIATPKTFHENFQTIATGPGLSFLGTDENSYITSFDVKAQKKNWGTYFIEEMLSIDVNESGETYFSGRTYLEKEIATSDGYMPTKGNNAKAYFIKLNNLGQRIWGSYYGGNVEELNNIIHLDSQQNIYLYGITIGSTTGIATPGAYQTTIKSDYDTFLAKFKDCSSIAKIESNSPICIGKTVELTASGGTNYSWTGPNGFISTDQNPTILNATASVSGEYFCLISGTASCDDTLKVTVFVEDTDAPIEDLAALPNITGDCSTIITTIPTATDACAGAIIATTSSPLSYNLPGTYTIVWNFDDGNGNSITQDQKVVISPQPLPTLTSPQTFCSQQNAKLSDISITGLGVKWYDAITSGNLLTNTTLIQNGKTYYASQTINGCESERVAIVTKIQNTQAPSGVATQSFCTGQNPTLSTIAVVGTAVKWYDISGVLLLNSTPLANNTSYYATQTVAGCESQNKLVVTITLNNSLPVTNFEENFCDDLNEGIRTTDLSSYNSKFISDHTNYNFSYFNSQFGAENELASALITDYRNYKLALGESKIYVRINSNTPCFAVAELKLTLFPQPSIPIDALIPICQNNTILVSAGTTHDNYKWSTGETTSSILLTSSGTYWVEVEDNHGTSSCQNRKEFTAVASDQAVITKIESFDWTDNDNRIAVLVTGNGDYEYSIDGIHFQDSNEFSNLINGKYTVTVKDKNGCGATTDDVYLLMYPKFFTPNNDGQNDTWSLAPSPIEEGWELKIFDRYGKLIKILLKNQSWDGTFNGVNLPATDYWFIATKPDGTEYKGHFSLKR